MRRWWLALAFFGCADQYATPPVSGDGAGPPPDGAADLGGGGEDAAPPGGPCEVTFRFSVQTAVSQVEARGEWNNFAAPGLVLASTGTGVFEGKLPLMPGVHGYKLVVDGEWRLDP